MRKAITLCGFNVARVKEIYYLSNRRAAVVHFKNLFNNIGFLNVYLVMLFAVNLIAESKPRAVILTMKRALTHTAYYVLSYCFPLILGDTLEKTFK